MWCLSWEIVNLGILVITWLWMVKIICRSMWMNATYKDKKQKIFETKSMGLLFMWSVNSPFKSFDSCSNPPLQILHRRLKHRKTGRERHNRKYIVRSWVRKLGSIPKTLRICVRAKFWLLFLHKMEISIYYKHLGDTLQKPFYR